MYATTWCRRGLVLPMVMVTLVVVLTVAAALQTMAWRATRGAQSQWDAQFATFASDAAIAQTLGAWSPESIAQLPIGVPQLQTLPAENNWSTQLSIVRTGTLVATVQAVTTRSTVLQRGDPGRVSRRVTEYVRLSPPSLPVLAAVTILGGADVNTSVLDGRDSFGVTDTLLNDCGLLRDTASIPALATGGYGITGTPSLIGTHRVLNAQSLVDAQQQFDRAWPILVSRAVPYPVVSPANMASPVLWRALVIESATTVTLTGVSEHTGLLIVDGDLEIQGILRVIGALIVRGTLTVTSGALDVRGALLVRDDMASGSRMNGATRVQYAPCALGRAFTAVARPQYYPFLTRNSP